MSWFSLSLPTPRMMKTSDSCISHPLITWSSYRLVRFCSCRYVTKGVIIIVRPPLSGDRRYLRGRRSSPRWSSVCPAVRQQCFTMMSQNWTHKSLCCWLYKSTSVSIVCPSYRATEETVVVFHILMTTCRLQLVLACMCVLIASHRAASVTRVSTRHWPCKRISPNHTGPSRPTSLVKSAN